MAETDTDANNAGEMLIDENATERTYGRIPAICDDLIIPFGEILERAVAHYYDEGALNGLIQRKQRLLIMKG